MSEVLIVDFHSGIGTVFGSLVVAYARNPSLKQQLFSYAILGFALSEAMGLFCLMMAFMYVSHLMDLQFEFHFISF